MQDFTWSSKEKQVARAVFERATKAEEEELLQQFKAKAAALKSLEDLWTLQSTTRDSERDYQQKYDYRYPQLLVVFGRLVREKRISLDELHGFTDEKLKYIERIASL